MDKPTVWKFVLPPGRNVRLEMPVGAVALDVQEQDEEIVLWALVNPGPPKEARYFTIVGTGDALGYYVEPRDYLGTVKVKAMVYHVFKGSW